MELRGQDNKEMGIPGSMVYNPPVRELSSSSSKLLSSSNGALTLNQSQLLDHHDPNPDPVSISIAGGSNSRTIVVRYRECLKNHAASIGGHVIDGCGEFMPNGEEGTPEALKCAACECHRNFHRKDIDGEPQSVISNRNPHHNHHHHHHHHPQLHPAHLPPQHQKFPLGFHSSPKGTNTVQPMMMAFGGGGGTESSSEDLNVLRSDDRGVRAGGSLMGGVSKKRFRTKFTQEQKEKMLEFAERVGWRTQKQDEPAVQEFCADVGVRRQVLKVWMHNNKHILKKKPL